MAEQLKVGGTIHFGAYDWRVLDIQGGKALFITKEILERRAYHGERSPVSWGECDLRAHLNGAFYSQFSPEQQARIIAETHQNPPNPWFLKGGGAETNDKIFLLSIEEVAAYFGGSGQLEDSNPMSDYRIDDQYNHNRQAKLNKRNCWWWLRSPGIRSHCAAFVFGVGTISVSGHYVNNEGGGVRPTLWLNLKGD